MHKWADIGQSHCADVPFSRLVFCFNSLTGRMFLPIFSTVTPGGNSFGIEVDITQYKVDKKSLDE